MKESELESEVLSAENNIEKRPVKRGDINREIEEYLGEDTIRVIKSLSKKEYSLLKKLNVDPKKSYFVKGSRENLEKFMAYFLTKCVYDRPSFMKIMLKEYIDGYLEKNDEGTFLLGADKPLLFLYLHKETSGIGNTDAWLGASTLDKVANRNRKGLATVVLSERNFKMFEDSSEFITIGLGGEITSKSVEEALKTASVVRKSETVNAVTTAAATNEISSMANNTGKPVVNNTIPYN